jgi:DNA-binding transcriptional ArsR family regulator
MSTDLASLHRILKDQTRRKIISQLDTKGSLSYTDLLNSLANMSTGTLNYHLKVLGDLLQKDADGLYLLSEKGKVASRLLLEFPKPDYALQAKKKWWRRFWVVAIALDAAGLLLVVSLNLAGYLDTVALGRGVFAFLVGIVFTYFYYRMIRPVTKSINKSQLTGAESSVNVNRTVQDIYVSGQSMQAVKSQIQSWINTEGITVETQRDGFYRGRLGIPSGLGLTAPKYFEVTLTQQANGINVHTEGWISVYDVSEKSFTPSMLAMGNIPRRKGWQVISRLWIQLREMSIAPKLM